MKKRNLFSFLRLRIRNNWWKRKEYHREWLKSFFFSWVVEGEGISVMSLDNILTYIWYCKGMSLFCECSVGLLIASWTFWITLISYWFTVFPREIHSNKWIWLKILFARKDWEVWRRGEKGVEEIVKWENNRNKMEKK